MSNGNWPEERAGSSGGVVVVEDTVTVRDARGRSVTFMIGQETAWIETPGGRLVVPRPDAARFALALVSVLMDVEARPYG